MYIQEAKTVTRRRDAKALTAEWLVMTNVADWRTLALDATGLAVTQRRLTPHQLRQPRMPSTGQGRFRRRARCRPGRSPGRCTPVIVSSTS
jgi:hypothetical protein